MINLFNFYYFQENDDPIILCRRPGSGKVLLCNVFNVWIDKAKLTHFQRWLESPKEMTRRLLRELVGEGNLIHMCARGKSRNTRSVPQDIMSVIECRLFSYILLFIIYSLYIYI